LIGNKGKAEEELSFSWENLEILNKIKKQTYEVCYSWEGLKRHFSNQLFLNPSEIPEEQFTKLRSQQNQVTFLIYNLEERANINYSLINIGLTVCDLCVLKGCFELLRNLLEGLLELKK
jgi:hypothetical protein